ncbi:MAG: hypothetical protein AB7O47_11860 [Flavobacteriales bacterium]
MKKKVIFILSVIVVISCFIYTSLYTNVFIDLLYKEKIWIHRTNSIEKLNEVKDKFYGIELDVVYIDSLNIFDVNHPPTESIGLSLDRYLSEAKSNTQLNYWLDFKNLNRKNAQASLISLENTCNKNNLKPSNFIVESNDVQLLGIFKDKGFQTSYYLHWPGLYTLDSTGLNMELEKINSNINAIDFNCYLSSDYHDYNILKKYFPNADILLWLDDNFNEKIKNRLELYKMLNNNNVKVILFKFKSHER